MTCYIHEVALSISHKCSTSETTRDVTQVYKMLISSSMEQKFKVRQVGVDMSSGFDKKKLETASSEQLGKCIWWGYETNLTTSNEQRTGY